MSPPHYPQGTQTGSRSGAPLHRRRSLSDAETRRTRHKQQTPLACLRHRRRKTLHTKSTKRTEFIQFAPLPFHRVQADCQCIWFSFFPLFLCFFWSCIWRFFSDTFYFVLEQN